MTKIKIPHGNNNNLSNQNEIQKYNAKSIYTMGFVYTAPASPAEETFNPTLGGAARFLHGIVLWVPTANLNDEDYVSLNINSEQVLKGTPSQSYLPNVNIYKEKQYYALNKILFGNDNVDFITKFTNTHKVAVTFYLSNAVPEF